MDMTGHPAPDPSAHRGQPTDMSALLRDALEGRASRVEIAPDALGDIRRRIAARRARWWRFPALRSRGATMISFSTALATGVAAVTIGFASCTPAPQPGPNHGTAAGPTATSGPSGTGTPTTGPTTLTTARVPIYYLGANDKLYREYHLITVGDGSPAAKVKAAITQMLDGRTAYDHDYSSQWPASASVRSVSITGGVATVDLHGATVNGFDPQGNKAALQQLIWTATAFTGGTGVKLLFDGQPRTTLWASQLPVAGVLHRAAAVDTLAPVWVIDPQAGSVVGPSFSIHVAGIVFEGTIQVRVLTSAGKLVVQKTVQLTVGAPAQGTGGFSMSLPPGTYMVEAYEVSLKDGSIVGLDGHTFSVR
jgi:spore germination protein GerM